MRIWISNTALNTVLFGQVPPKPNKIHNLYPISKLPDGSGSRLKKPGSGSGSAKKPVPSRSESEILETILAVRD